MAARIRACRNCCFWATWNDWQGVCMATDGSVPESTLSVSVQRKVGTEIVVVEGNEYRGVLITPLDHYCSVWQEKTEE